MLIVNKGSGGDSSFDLIRRLRNDVIMEKPDLVFLSVGMNDMLNLDKFVDYDTFRKNYQRIIQTLADENIETVLLNLVPVDTLAISSWYNEGIFQEKAAIKVRKANEIIKDLANSNGLPLLDLFEAFVAANTSSELKGTLIMNQENSGVDDGVHPTKDGYKVIAQKIFNFLLQNKKLQTGKKFVCFGDNITYGAHVVGAGTNSGDTYPGLLRKMILWDYLVPYFSTPFDYEMIMGDYKSPLLFEDGEVASTVEMWEKRREEILKEWHDLMGEWPELITDPEMEVLEETNMDGYVQKKIQFEWVTGQPTTGYLLVPFQSKDKPAVITVYYEPETAIGEGKPDRDFAKKLVERGFVTLSLGTTETTENETYSIYYPHIDSATVQPLSMLAYAAANAWHLLASLEEVNEDKIGIMGHSYGGKWAMFASCLFDKFAAAAWSDPGIVFEEDKPSVNYWEPWYLGYHPPPWRKRGMPTDENPAKGLYPELLEKGKDLHELHALMAPRPFFVSGGSEDPEERWVVLNHSIEVNSLYGFENRVGMSNRPEHAPDQASNEAIFTFFEYFLEP
ncbi:GDSL-type esterase/lipase family protein [Pleomorphovibrio marinus]|uniref:GDSL-type esterase/lipase family protein n=1 Tax=Pleomorphovibrio marinus TaxID=2164132 RepID=UPI0018E4F5F3|nr:GDSL-type esterase/lipase family protein [Pleomorphovibrio marinus]